MFSLARQPSAGSLLAAQSSTLSRLLLPCLDPSHRPNRRSFTASPPTQSRIGRAPIAIPADVQINILEPKVPSESAVVRRTKPLRIVQVEGPLGHLNLPVPDFVQINRDDESKKIMISVLDKSIRKQRELWGTTRARIYNNILGVSEGHTAILRLNGVGYRASIEPTAVNQEPEYPGQQFVSLKLGYSHPVDLPIPQLVKTTVPQPTRILLEGIDKDEVTQFAAEIREWKRPEPYKGKGIFLGDETIRLKAKKIK